ncbi:hypothetical protein KO465_01500, partial [Candidatus Micrarchaeota archaeon]|nr:hypothetical protein [Candidatus Micrarchaeota archaeon]
MDRKLFTVLILIVLLNMSYAQLNTVRDVSGLKPTRISDATILSNDRIVPVGPPVEKPISPTPVAIPESSISEPVVNIIDKSELITLPTNVQNPVEYKTQKIHLLDPGLKIGESQIIDGIQYVVLYSNEEYSETVYSDCPQCPAIPYAVVHWIVPAEFSEQDVKATANIYYSNKEEVDYRIAPPPKLVKSEIQEFNDQEEVVPPLIVSLLPNKEAYERGGMFEGKIKIGKAVNAAEGIKMVPIYVPIAKIGIDDGKTYVHRVEHIEIEINYPYKNIERPPSRFETLISKMGYNSNEYAPTTPKSKTQQSIKGTKSGGSASNPQLLTAADLTNPNIEVDYLIITAPAFYPASPSTTYPLYDFAMHKKDYNGFNVAIVNFDDIVATYPNTGQYYREGDIPLPYITSGTNSHRIRNFLQFAWENWEGVHMIDEKPGYLLLVGDADRGEQNANWFLPTAMIYNRFCEMGSGTYCDAYSDEQLRYYATDTCYSDIYGECVFDDITFIVGRFPVQTTAQLSAVVGKTIHFEDNPAGAGEEWLKTYASQIFFLENQAQTTTSEIFFEKPVPAIMSKEWNVKYLRPSFYGNNFETKQRQTAEEGAVLFTYDGHGSRYNGAGGILNDFAGNNINNANKNMIFLSEACQPGFFQHSDDCWAEKNLRDTTYPNRGPVLTTAYSGLGIINMYDRMPVHLLLRNHTMLVYDTSGDLMSTSTFGHTTYEYASYYMFNVDITSQMGAQKMYVVQVKMLFGDPSLDNTIFTEDYVVEEDRPDEIIVNQIQFPDPNLVAGRTVEAQSFVHNAGSSTLTNLDFTLGYDTLTYLTHYGGLSYSTLATTTLDSIAPNETKMITFSFTMPSQTDKYAYFRVKMDEVLDEYGDEADNGYVLVVNHAGSASVTPALVSFWMSSSEFSACGGSPPLNPNQYGACEGSKQKCVGGAWQENYMFVTANKNTNFGASLLGPNNRFPNWINENCNDRSDPASPWHDGQGSLSYVIPEEDTYWNVGSWFNGKNEVVPKFNNDVYNCGSVGNVCQFDEFCFAINCEAAEFQIPNPYYIPGWTPEFLDVDVEAYQGIFCPTAECVKIDKDGDGYADYIPLLHATYADESGYGYDLFNESLGSSVDSTQTYDYTNFMFGSTGKSMVLGNDIEFWANRQYDCNDDDIYTNPAMNEICDGIDNNCAGICVGGSEDGTTCHWGDYYDAETWTSYIGSTLHRYVELSYGTVKRCEVGGGTCNYIDEGLPAAATFYRDADEDGYGDPDNFIESCSESMIPEGYVDNNLDCDDTNPDIYPGTPAGTCAICDEGGNLVFEDRPEDCAHLDTTYCLFGGNTKVYREGYCSAIHTCAAIVTGSENCKNYNTDNYCSGNTVVFDDWVCAAGDCVYSNTITVENCAVNNLAPIETCFHSPDDIPFTWDFRPAFTSTCVIESEEAVCTVNAVELEHTCSRDMCAAPCDEDNPCEDTPCFYLSGCVGNDWHEYDDVPNTCLDNCDCEMNECDSEPTHIYENDARCVECTIDVECSHLNNEYCTGDSVMQDTGVCIDYACQVETTE